MGIYKMNARRYVLVLGVIFMLVFAVLLSLRSFHGDIPAADGREPERGGPKIVAISGTSKLNALLPAPSFFAIKQDVSNYVQMVDRAAQTASIQTTQFNQDGSIYLVVAVPGSKSFSARVYQSSDRLIFQVASSNYRASQSIDDINNVYTGEK